jgi:hypothetical protein
MPKTLHEPPPTSAVARLLNREVANRAIEPIRQDSAATRRTDSMASPGAAIERDDVNIPLVKREFILTDEVEGTFCEILSLFRRTTRTRLTASQLFRSILKAIHQTLPVLQYEADKLGPLRLPGNSKEARQQREEFEQRIATAFAAAFRATAAIQGSAHESAPTRNRPGR